MKDIQVLVFLHIAAAIAVAEVCDNATFPVDLGNFQILGLTQVAAAQTVAQCRQACCNSASCKVWQFAAGGQASPPSSCWNGPDGERMYVTGWISRGRDVPPAPPPPSPPPPYNLFLPCPAAQFTMHPAVLTSSTAARVSACVLKESVLYLAAALLQSCSKITLQMLSLTSSTISSCRTLASACRS